VSCRDGEAEPTGPWVCHFPLYHFTSFRTRQSRKKGTTKFGEIWAIPQVVSPESFHFSLKVKRRSNRPFPFWFSPMVSWRSRPTKP
jgi:hypothetical protein